MNEYGNLLNFSYTCKPLSYGKDIFTLLKRRNIKSYLQKPKNKRFHYIIKFDDVIILSKIEFENRIDSNFRYYISLEENGEQITLDNERYACSGGLKTIYFHFLPCKYVHFITSNNQRLPEKKFIECYGFHKNNFREKYGEEMLRMIYHKTSQIIYQDNHNLLI